MSCRVVSCRVVWCGVVWCGVVWCGVWCGVWCVVWCVVCDVVCGVVCGVWCGVGCGVGCVVCGVVWCGVLCGVWCGVWCVVWCVVWCGVCGVGCVVQRIHNTASLSWRVRTMHLIRVAEHLGASSRRPRHPFSALMAGETWPCTCVHGPTKKKTTHQPQTAPVELHNRDIDHSCSSTTATIALQLELEVVVVVGANNVNAAEPAIQQANKPNALLVLEIIDDVFSSHRPHAVPNRTVKLSGVKPQPPHDIATQTPPQQGNLQTKSTRSRQMQWQRWSSMQTHPTSSWYWK